MQNVVRPISPTIRERRAKHAEDCGWSKDLHMKDILLWTPTHGHTSITQPVKPYTYQFRMDSGYSFEYLLSPMANSDRRWERVKGILVDTFWWWKMLNFCTFQFTIFTYPTTSVLDMTLNHLMVRLQSLSLEGMWSTPSLPLILSLSYPGYTC